MTVSMLLFIFENILVINILQLKLIMLFSGLKEICSVGFQPE